MGALQSEIFDSDAILKQTQHRAWPIPQSPWIMQQVWYGLLFAHWPLPAEQVRALIPDELELDTFGGEAWISLTPFRLNVTLRGLSAFGDMLSFPELNCRTYVRYKGHEGIYFFSLDAASRLAVMGAQSLYRLPYFFATMEHDEKDGRIWFRSERRERPAELEAVYQPIGEAREALNGTLEHWL
ncbi:MAG TPA: DUF2071 domain-containing protein, partial [Edaphobacter sp.]|nr:DUF2071 domain-containing protein [Edaphobacter sp.]